MLSLGCQSPTVPALAPHLIPHKRNAVVAIMENKSTTATRSTDELVVPCPAWVSSIFHFTGHSRILFARPVSTIPRSIPLTLHKEALCRTSADLGASFVRAPFSHISSGFQDAGRGDENVAVCARTPFVFDCSTNVTFYMSPLAMSELASGLYTRSRPACVIMNMGVARGLEFDDMDWSMDSLRMLNTPNAGGKQPNYRLITTKREAVVAAIGLTRACSLEPLGSSLLSEVLSCEVLGRCLGARLARTEMEIKYLFAYQPITDYTITLPNVPPRMHVGVSVTRAFAFKGAYRKADCRKLLRKKLLGIQASTKNVLGERFFKQILHVWVPNGKVARTVQATYRSLPREVTRNTVVLIMVSNARWVFSNRR
jgi:hypothetical protein